jgi:alpha-tubulin suppressor-like RCC1 family protein
VSDFNVLRWAALAAAPLCISVLAAAQNSVVGWGLSAFDSRWNSESFSRIATGFFATIGVRSNGTLAAWGLNDYGQCQPPAPPPGTQFVEASLGMCHGVGRLNNGTLVAWGANGAGQLNVPALPPGVQYVQIACGDVHTAALRSDGVVVAWGGNGQSQTSVPFLPPGLSYTQIDAGQNFNVALRSDGRAIAWGQASSGSTTPPAPPPGQSYVDVAAGGWGNAPFGLALRSDGQIVGWGDNTYWQLNVPTPPPGVTYVDVEAGGVCGLARRSDGAVVTWGLGPALPAIAPGTNIVELDAGNGAGTGSGFGILRRGNGQLVMYGSSIFCETNVPPLPAGVVYTKVEAGEGYFGHFVGLRSDGVARAWGPRSFNETDVPPPPPGVSIVDFVAGAYGSAFRWSNGVWRLTGDHASLESSTPGLPPGVQFVQLDLGETFVAALRSDGEISCWGNNFEGQCNVPSLASGLEYVQVAVGTRHTVALLSDGQVLAWGRSAEGQLAVPPLPSGVVYTKVFASGNNSGALRSDGNRVVWGANPIAASSVPGLTWADVVLGGDLYCDVYGACTDRAFAHLLRSDGSVANTGNNTFRQRDLPNLPAGMGLLQLDSGYHASIALYGPTYGFTTPYCASAVTSGGCLPLMSGIGRASASAATPFTIAVGAVDGARTGLIFYGVDNTGFAPLPWFNAASLLCVKSPFQRTGTQSTGGAAGSCNGALTVDWNAYLSSNPNALGAPFAPLERIYAQGWFRDPAVAGGSHLSNALDIAVHP